MGTWDKLPWDNDGAADWFDDLFDKTKLAKHVEDTLKLDVANSYQEIRAAAAVLLFLGRDYIWPVQDLDRHLLLAADKLEEINRLDEVAESGELVSEIQSEIRELRSRVKAQGPSQSAPASPKRWWQFWGAAR